MTDQPPQSAGAKAQMLNDRTFQEVEYLKKNLGPILVAALAEICIRRPADPIEYLGHWLLRWRYNEELKRRDVQNTLDIVKQKAAAKDDELSQNPYAQSLLQGFAPAAAAQPATSAFAPPAPANTVTSVAAAEEPASSGEAPPPEGKIQFVRV